MVELDVVCVTVRKLQKYLEGLIWKSLNTVNNALVYNVKLPITSPKKNGGGSANRNIVQLINIGGCIQFSVPNPPLVLAANR
jgi:hypothetical protein